MGLPQKKPKILVVDDDLLFRQTIAQALSSDFTVVLAENGSTALKIFKQENPEIIVTDLVMPHVDGFVFISELRQISAVPVIAMSRGEVPGTIEALQELGATAFICKTSAPIAFLIKIRETLDRFSS